MESLSREELLRCVSLQRRRLRWRHWFCFYASVLVMAVCVAGMFDDLTGRGNRAALPAWIVGYVAAAAGASMAVARFDVRRGLAQLPAVAVLGPLAAAVVLSVHAVRKVRVKTFAASRARWAQQQQPVRPNIVGMLLERAEVESVLGAQLDPSNDESKVGRSSWTSCYRGRGGLPAATVRVGSARPWWLPRPAGEPVPELGDTAATNGYGLWGDAGEWTYTIAGIDGTGRPLATAQLAALARLVVDRLPRAQETDAFERGWGVFGDGRGGALNHAMAALGLPLLEGSVCAWLRRALEQVTQPWVPER